MKSGTASARFRFDAFAGNFDVTSRDGCTKNMTSSSFSHSHPIHFLLVFGSVIYHIWRGEMETLIRWHCWDSWNSLTPSMKVQPRSHVFIPCPCQSYSWVKPASGLEWILFTNRGERAALVSSSNVENLNKYPIFWGYPVPLCRWKWSQDALLGLNLWLQPLWLIGNPTKWLSVR